MTKIKSVFGAYSDKLQVVVDKANDRFAPVWFRRFFDFGVPKVSLTFETAIGRSRIEAAASVVDHNASAPLRSRQALEKLSGSVPAIKEKIGMTAQDYRDYLTLQNLNVDDVTKRNAILDMMFGDIKKVGDSAFKRLDFMCLQGISTGKISLDVTNNPDGIVTGEIDLLMPADNFRTVAEKWSIAETATPITDIKNTVQAAEDKGIQFEKILMTRQAFWKLQAATETKQMLAGFFKMSTGQKRIGTLDEINDMLGSYQFPVIELVNEAIGIEKDGKITVKRPFNETSAVFIPAGKLGIIHNAIAIEELSPVQNVTYAKYDKALISKWASNDPFGEWTAVELNAFPGIESIDRIFILDVETKAA